MIHFCSDGSSSYEEFGTANKLDCGRRTDIYNAIKDEINGKNEEEMHTKYKGTWKRYRRYIRETASDTKLITLNKIAEQ